MDTPPPEPTNEPARVFEVKDKTHTTTSVELDHFPPAEKDTIIAQNAQRIRQMGESTREHAGRSTQQFGRDKNLTTLINDKNISAKAVQEAIRTSADPPISDRVPSSEVSELNSMVRARMNSSQDMPSRASIANRSLHLSTSPEDDATAMQANHTNRANHTNPSEYYPPSVKTDAYRRSPFQRYESELEFPPLFGGYPEDKYYVASGLGLKSGARVNAHRDAPIKKAPFQRYDSETEFPPLFGGYPEDKYFGATNLVPKRFSKRDSPEFRPLFGNYADAEDRLARELDIRANIRRSDLGDEMHELKENISKRSNQLGRGIEEATYDIKEKLYDSKENVQKDARFIGREVKDIVNESPDVLSSWWISLTRAFTPSQSTTKENVKDMAADLADRVHGVMFKKTGPGYHGEYEKYIPGIDHHGDIRDVEIGSVDTTHFGN